MSFGRTENLTPFQTAILLFSGPTAGRSAVRAPYLIRTFNLAFAQMTIHA